MFASARGYKTRSDKQSAPWPGRYSEIFFELSPKARASFFLPMAKIVLAKMIVLAVYATAGAEGEFDLAPDQCVTRQRLKSSNINPCGWLREPSVFVGKEIMSPLLFSSPNEVSTASREPIDATPLRS